MQISDDCKLLELHLCELSKCFTISLEILHARNSIALSS